MNRRVSERRTLEGSFFFIIQNPPLVELKIVLDDLYNFFKFNLYGYNTNTIKKCERFLYFPLIATRNDHINYTAIKNNNTKIRKFEADKRSYRYMINV
jgi:hypothetical protein